jgi:hypothetical protein
MMEEEEGQFKFQSLVPEKLDNVVHAELERKTGEEFESHGGTIDHVSQDSSSK